jgi:hypothetical protein
LASKFLLIILPLSILELTAISSRRAIVCLVRSCMRQSRKSNQNVAVLSTAMHLSHVYAYACTANYKADQTQTLLLTYISSDVSLLKAHRIDTSFPHTHQPAWTVMRTKQTARKSTGGKSAASTRRSSAMDTPEQPPAKRKRAA